jgi:hypothetical protein
MQPKRRWPVSDSTLRWSTYRQCRPGDWQQARARRLVLTHIGGVTHREQLAAMREPIAREYRGPIAFAEDLDRF